ncbi:MAG: hypothetical protein ABI683_15485 [Ginsengibacter sp.]
MKNKLMPLMISGLLISFSALSQTSDSATHPKLSAFRQLKANSQAANDSAVAASMTATNNVIDNSATTPAAPAATTGISKKTNAPTAIVNNPAPVTRIQEQPAPVATPQQAHVYIDTRLGSSTPQYDTYKKNNYGAGSVTTSPK